MKDQYYLDNASTSWPKPEQVYRFMDEFNRRYGVNPGRASHEMALEAEKMVAETRHLLAQFFGYSGDFQRVIFTQNATDSLNMTFHGLLEQGDHVVSTRTEHNSVLRPLHQFHDSIDTTYLDRDPYGYIDPDQIKTAIKPNTKLVAINHASNVLGSLQDLKAIGEIVRNTSALLIVDTCQSAGLIPIHMENTGIDVLVFTGHKGLYGPMGVGGLIIAKGVDIKPARVGGTGVNSISFEQPEQYPYRLEAGTHNVPGIAGLNAAQKWFAELGQQSCGDSTLGHAEACASALELIQQHELGHIQQLDKHFRETSGVTVHGPLPGNPRVATLSISFEKFPSTQVGDIMDADYHICVRTGLHCAPLVHVDENTVEHEGTVRFSLSYFNDQEDIDQAIKAVKEISEF